MKSRVNTFTRSAWAATVVAAMTTPAALYADIDFPRLAPASSVMAIWAQDLPTLSKAAEESAYGRLWMDPAMEDLRGQVAAMIKDIETGQDGEEAFPLNEFMEHLKGGAGLFFLPGAGGSLEMNDMSITGIMETDEAGVAWFNEKVDGLSNLFSEHERTTYETSGVTVYRLSGTVAVDALIDAGASPNKTIQYTTIDNVILISDSASDDPMKDTIAVMKGASPSPRLAEREETRSYTAQRSFQPNQLNFFLDTRTLIRQGLDTAAGMDPTVRDGLPSTGLLDFQALFATTALSPESADVDVALALPQTKNGIVKAYSEMGTTPLETLAMAPADSLGITSFALDAGRLYDSIMNILDTTAPQISGLARMMILSQQGQMGVNFVDDIIRNIAGEHLVVQREFAEEIRQQLNEMELATFQSTAYFIGLQNGATVERTLKQLFQKLQEDPLQGGMFEIGEENGVTTVRPSAGMLGEGAIEYSFAFNQRYIVVANNQIQLREAIRALTSGVANPVTETPGMQSILGGINRNRLMAFSYSPHSAVRASMDQVRRFAEMGMLDEIEGFEPSMLPSAQVVEKYLGESYSTVHLHDRLLIMSLKAMSAE